MRLSIDQNGSDGRFGLKSNFLFSFDLNIAKRYYLVYDIGVPPRRINEIVKGQRGISADTALRLSRYFGTSERFWMNLQSRYDLEVEKDRLKDRLEQEVKVLAH